MINLQVLDIRGFECAIHGMRNPMNSWDKSDSMFVEHLGINKFVIGQSDLDLAKRLSNAGTDHRKYLRMIEVWIDINAPLYWWKEFDTYKVGTVANSCSTMHKIQAKRFEPIDFSNEHLTHEGMAILNTIIAGLNVAREDYLDAIKNKETEWAKTYWWQMIQLLPSSYNQKRTVMLSYEVLSNIYKSRKNHKLDEWIDFCNLIKKLPYSELITHEPVEDNN